MADDQAFEDASLSDSQIEAPNTDLNEMQSIMWYGISSIINAFITIVFYLIFNYNGTVAAFYEVMLSHQIAYWPVSIGWAAIALFDSDFSRELYKAVVSVSVLGPFAGHIVGLVFIFINADSSNLWNRWEFWLLWPLYVVYIVGQMLIQFLLLPKIYDFLDADALSSALSYFN